MLHTNQPRTTILELSDIKIPVPADAGEDWNGINHDEVVKGMLKAIKLNDLEVRDWQAVVTKNQKNLAASFDLAGPEIVLDKGRTIYYPSIGILTNNERRKATQFYYGIKSEDSLVSIVLGNVTDGKRFTINTFIPSFLKETVSDAAAFFTHGGILHVIEELRATKITDEQACAYMMEPCRLPQHKGRFPWRKLGYVDTMWRGLTKGSRKKEERNLWNLLKSFAYANATCEPTLQLQQALTYYNIISSKIPR